jgi:hypothetical protein
MSSDWTGNPDRWLPLTAFYDAEPQRRSSKEIALGTDWTDANGSYGLAWLAETGELYLSSRFATSGTWLGAIVEGLLGDSAGYGFGGQLRATVIAVIPDQAELERCFVGWEKQMSQKDSLRWVREQLSGLDG